MITVKSTAHFTVFRREMTGVFGVIEDVFRAHNVPCEITCGTDSHPMDDPHPHGFADDFESHQIPQSELKPIHEELIQALGPAYTVLYSDKNLSEAVYVDTPNAHFHIQLRKDLWHAIVAKENM